MSVVTGEMKKNLFSSEKYYAIIEKIVQISDMKP